MKLKTLVSAITAICFSLFLAIGFFSSAPALALGDFSQTCDDVSIGGSTLSADCRRRNGSYNSTSINLNPDIENVNGSLKWQPSNFIETCRNTALAGGGTMEAECKTRDQRWVSTRINLDDHIANIDGNLKYE
ncbi:MAG: CVNH domain-containing protein [Cyanobacteria bacterium P01_A01_bin.83]